MDRVACLFLQFRHLRCSMGRHHQYRLQTAADALTRSLPPSSAETLATSNGPLSNYRMSNGVVVATSPRRRRKEVCNSKLPICLPALASFLLIAAWMGCRSRWENVTREMGCPVRIHPVLRFVSFADSSTAMAWTALLWDWAISFGDKAECIRRCIALLNQL